MKTFEVEIKVFLGNEDEARKFYKKIASSDSGLRQLAKSLQLNHYFEKGNVELLFEQVAPILHHEKQQQLRQLLTEAKHHVVRTRQANDTVLFIVKAMADETTSANGTARLEYEVPIAGVTLEELDKRILGSGFSYQSKWSRERVEYRYKDYTICIDKNAGYGYLAEFEKIVTDEGHVAMTKQEIRDELAALELQELSQERLARMFAYYNDHWKEYYKTDKTFIIE